MSKIVFLFFILILATWGHPASGASLLVSSSGGGVYSLQGVGLVNAAGIDVTITYDSTTLSNPHVVRGGLISGAMVAVNPNSPGVIRLAAVKNGTMEGTGVIATISFTTVEGGSGKILSMGASIIDSNGSQLGVQTQVLNPVSGYDAQDTSAASGNSSSVSGGSGQTYLDPAGGALPSEPGLSANRESSSDNNSSQTETPLHDTGDTETVADVDKETDTSTTSADTGKDVVYKSVLAYFSEYTGKRNFKAFKDLFSKGSMPGIRQEPQVALSDGKTIVKVSILLPSVGEKAPHFTVKKAKSISLKTVGKSCVIEVLPDKNAYDSSIVVLNNGVTTEIPLAVAPPMNVDISNVDAAIEYEADSSVKRGGSSGKPRLNKKRIGALNYMKDYVLTANYIVKMNSRATQLKQKKK